MSDCDRTTARVRITDEKLGLEDFYWEFKVVPRVGEQMTYKGRDAIVVGVKFDMDVVNRREQVQLSARWLS